MLSDFALVCENDMELSWLWFVIFLVLGSKVLEHILTVYFVFLQFHDCSCKLFGMNC